MLNNRRKFIRAAAAFASLSALKVAPAGAAQRSALAEGERDVAALIARFGTSLSVTREAGAVAFRVKSRGPRAFARALDGRRGLPFERIHVGENNTLTFRHAGTRFTILAHV